jgi:hypothetical protein
MAMPAMPGADDEGSIPFTRSNKIRGLLKNDFPEIRLGRSLEDP